MKRIIDFEILPIFSQSANPRIWHDFTELEMKCDSEKYGYHTDDTDRQRIYRENMDYWNSYKCNIAFAAYHGEQMLGFATGYRDEDKPNKNSEIKHKPQPEICLHKLYVDPKYNGMGIGGALLNKIETAGALMEKSIRVVALNGAVSFYELHGYNNLDDRNMGKILGPCMVGVVPVFQWFHKIQSKLNMDVDASLLHKNKHEPIFVYINTERKIDGVIARGLDGKNNIWVNERKGRVMSDYYTEQLSNAMMKAR